MVVRASSNNMALILIDSVYIPTLHWLLQQHVLHVLHAAIALHRKLLHSRSCVCQPPVLIITDPGAPLPEWMVAFDIEFISWGSFY